MLNSSKYRWKSETRVLQSPLVFPPNSRMYRVLANFSAILDNAFWDLRNRKGIFIEKEKQGLDTRWEKERNVESTLSIDLRSMTSSDRLYWIERVRTFQPARTPHKRWHFSVPGSHKVLVHSLLLPFPSFLQRGTKRHSSFYSLSSATFTVHFFQILRVLSHSFLSPVILCSYFPHFSFSVRI